MLGFAHHYATSRSAERLVGGRRDKVGVRNRARMKPGCDQARDMCDVDHEVGAHRLGYVLKLREVKDASIGTCPDNNHPGTAIFSELPHRVIIDGFGLAIHPIRKSPEDHAGKIDLAAMGQVAPLRQVHTENCVSWLEDG